MGQNDLVRPWLTNAFLWVFEVYQLITSKANLYYCQSRLWFTGSNRASYEIPSALRLSGTGQIVSWQRMVRSKSIKQWVQRGHLQRVLEMLIYLHDGSLISTAVTVIGR